MNSQNDGLGIGKITLFAIGATLASGVFSLSGDFAAAGSHTLSVLIGWAICGIGMLSLTLCFFRLSIVRPDLTSGLYSYAKSGFGDYVGFNSAWGFWLSMLLGNLSFITLLFASLGNFFPIFGNGNNIWSIICGSLLIWFIAVLLMKGVSEALALNTIVVIAKTIPIIIMIFAIALSGAFSLDIFFENFAGNGTGMSLLGQTRSTVYTTVWVFVGIEGAVVISARAKSTEIAGKATVLAFISLFALYFLISVLSMGVLPTEELAQLSNPPMASLLDQVVGSWGKFIVNLGVIISIAGALFTCTILCVESLYAPATQKCFPKYFTTVNQNNAPTKAILITTIVMQVFLVVMYFNDATYQVCYTLSTSAIMIPYALCAFYCLKLTMGGYGMSALKTSEKAWIWTYSILGSLYGIWMLYASSITNILISALLYAPGVLLYAKAKREENALLFPRVIDKVVFILLLVMAVVSAIMIFRGSIKL
ncbi:MAG: amino acid permease [Firmicutes bacterium]|nr:amino acid permease [Bacillota bacterium]